MAPRVLSGLKEASKDYIDHKDEIAVGLSIGLKSGLGAVGMRRQLFGQFRAFGLEYAAYTAGLYAIAIGIGITVLAPVSLLLFFIYPTGE
jgi:hypothetical protein